MSLARANSSVIHLTHGRAEQPTERKYQSAWVLRSCSAAGR